MRKYLVLVLIPMFFAVTACQKSNEETAPESSAPAASAEASPAAPATGGEAAPNAGGMAASPAAVPSSAGTP